MFENLKKVASKLMYAVPVAVFLGFVFYITTFTYTGAVQKTIENTNWTFNSFERLSNKFEKTLQEGIYKKYGFINLNGGIAKYLGFNSLNSVQKLANGYLTWFDSIEDIIGSLQSTIELNKFLSERGISFLYVIMPSKSAMYDAKFAPGYHTESKKYLDEMVSKLSKAGIYTLDMGSWFKEHDWHMEDVYFKTDHHWKPEASLVTARQTMDSLQQKGLTIPKDERLQWDNYRIKVLKNRFLGSQGKRTGKYYAGVDDISVYYPRFKTDYSLAGLTTRTSKWFYSNNLLNLDLVREKKLFEKKLNEIYMYRDFSFRVTKNAEGLNEKKILITGDSFKTMVEYFLTTQFQRIYGFDTRYNTDETLAQCIEEIKPDIVVMYMNAGGLTDERLFKFGVADYNKALAETDLNEPATLLGEFVIPAQSKNNNFVAIDCNLDAGQAYTISIDRTEVLKGRPKYIQVTLMNQTTAEPITNHHFEVARTDKQKWIFFVPKELENYGLYLYAGTKGCTAGNSIKITNMLLYKGIRED